ncbi:type VII secretion effector [Streptococcus criceti]|uniref:TIGR04197 family type VII secretion effector n=1 Tax=Streptococcus criceti HS-6 TaxID=873449 RepID=G5JNA7_STRCG|nr:TIGR04197 family type VII secretion effector [Streptococcus criceti]EHI75375.1 hypothetical protein STRCR_0144 [Streptococcus criceti HS-6]SUN41656.1 type VII secretion effector [Streptococcus criceti]
MSTIQSHMAAVNSHTSALHSVEGNLSGINEAGTDDQTTVSGNAKAHEAISEAAATVKELSTNLSALSDSFKSIAAGFESADQSATQSLHAQIL